MKFQPKYYKTSPNTVLNRYERIYVNGKFITLVCNKSPCLISDFVRFYGISPDLVTKKVSYKLVSLDDLPF